MTVIRDAVIRIRTERSGQSGGGFEARAFQSEAKAAREAAHEIDGASRGLQEHTRHVADFGTKSLHAFARAGSGALQLTKAFALLATSNEEDAQKIIQGLVKIEATVQAVHGAYKLLTSSALIGFAAALNPVTASLIVIATLVAASAAAWKYWGDSAQDAANRATIAGIAAQKTYQGILKTIEDIRRAEMDRRLGDEGFAVGNAVTTQARRTALEAQRTSLGGEFSAAEKQRSDLAGIDVSGQSRDVQAGHTRQLAEAEKTTLEILKQKAQVERDLLELRKAERQEQLRQQQQGAKGWGSLFGSGASSTLNDLAQRSADADVKKFEQEAQTTIDKLSKIFSDLNGTLEKHETDLKSLER